MSETSLKNLVKLDWSRLLGFDQVSERGRNNGSAMKLDAPQLAKIGGKVGSKIR